MKVLVIEDNPRLAEKVKKQLQKCYIVEVADSGEAALNQLIQAAFDCILLDLGLPDMPGLELCRRIRKLSIHIPILVVTGVDNVNSRVALLAAGADDYITKPFEFAELKARIIALTRRSPRTTRTDKITVGDLVLEPATRKVTRAGINVALRKKEFDILEYLMLNVGHVVSRQAIINQAWPITARSWTGSVDVHIKQLRDKIDKPFNNPLIKTYYGVGYMVDVPEVNNNQKGEPQS